MATQFPSTATTAMTSPSQPGNGGGGDARYKSIPAEVMERALSSARVDEHYCFASKIDFIAIRDHILPSRCNHQENQQCQVSKLFENSFVFPFFVFGFLTFIVSHSF